MMSWSSMSMVLLVPKIHRAKNSSALQRANDLDAVAGGERGCRPVAAAHDGAVDGDGEKPRLRVDAAFGEQLGDGGDPHLLLDAVDLEAGHCAASSAATLRRAGSEAKRSGENGRAISGSRPLK